MYKYGETYLSVYASLPPVSEDCVTAQKTCEEGIIGAFFARSAWIECSEYQHG